MPQQVATWAPSNQQSRLVSVCLPDFGTVTSRRNRPISCGIDEAASHHRPRPCAGCQACRRPATFVRDRCCGPWGRARPRSKYNQSLSDKRWAQVAVHRACRCTKPARPQVAARSNGGVNAGHCHPHGRVRLHIVGSRGTCPSEVWPERLMLEAVAGFMKRGPRNEATRAGWTSGAKVR